MKNEVKVWDPLIRIFHWGLVLFFTIAYLTGEDESDLHIYAGYTVLGLISFRLLWGFTGTKYARFSDFVKSPSTIIDYARNLFKGSAKHYLGHNPLGGAMIVTMLISLFMLSYTGLKIYAIEEGKGPLAMETTVTFVQSARADDDGDEYKSGEESEEEEFWEEIHEFFANLMLLLVILHIAGVVVSSRLEHQNLVRAMITGRKKQDQDY